jgi:multiple sugar transport system permease protein
MRAEVAAVREFRRRFPRIFAERYRDRYRADPETYGEHNWDNVEVELHQFSGIQVEGVEGDLLAIAGGVAPDVMYVNFRKSHTYIQQGFLYPLNLDGDGYLTRMSQEEKDFRIHPKIWPVIERRGPDGLKRVWAIPYGGALGKVCLYRKDLFEESGVPFPHNNWTWDDFYEACRRITNPSEGIYGVQFARGKHESWYWITFLWSAGGDVLEYNDAADEWRAVFDSREAAVALDFYTRVCTEPWIDERGKQRRGYSSKDAAEQGAKWARGEIGMMFSYIDEKLFSTINPDVTGMVPVPIGPTGLRGGELNSRMMGLFSGIEDPAVRDAAWEYVRFYDCEDAMAIKTRVMVEGGLGRFVNPRYLRMFGYPEVIRLSPRGWAECFEIAIDTGKPEPYGRGSNLAYNIMTFPIEEAEQLALQEQLPEAPEARLDVMQGLLRDAVHMANEEMLRKFTPAERLKRRVVAGVTLVVIVLVFVLVFRWIARVFTPVDVLTGVRRAGWQFRRYAWGYIILIPAVFTIFFWQYLPLARGSVMAFQDYRIMGDSTWVWLDNFGDVMFNSLWWDSVRNSLRYSFLVIALTFLPPVILAILLQEVPRGKLVFRTIYYLPAVITGLVVILLWKSFYDPSEHGALNAVLLRIPALGFVVLGLVLLVIALAFAERLLYHHVDAVACVFVVVGASLFYTCFAIARPALAQGGVPALLFGSSGALLAGLLLAIGRHSVLRQTHGRLAAARERTGLTANPRANLLLTAGLVGAVGGELLVPWSSSLFRVLSLALAVVVAVWGYLLLRRGEESHDASDLAPAFAGAAGLLGLLGIGGLVLVLGRHGTAPFAALATNLFSQLPEPYRWLGGRETAMFCCVLPMVWAGMGPGCLIYLAALKGIADDFYEAADIDGATFVDKILFVVFPILKPLLIINFVGVFIGSWNSTANILAMTGGGAGTEVAGLHIFYKAFIFLKFGPATAMAWILGVMLIGFTVYQLRILSRLEFRTTGDKK